MVNRGWFPVWKVIMKRFDENPKAPSTARLELRNGDKASLHLSAKGHVGAYGQDTTFSGLSGWKRFVFFLNVIINVIIEIRDWSHQLHISGHFPWCDSCSIGRPDSAHTSTSASWQVWEVNSQRGEWSLQLWSRRLVFKQKARRGRSVSPWRDLQSWANPHV